MSKIVAVITMVAVAAILLSMFSLIMSVIQRVNRRLWWNMVYRRSCGTLTKDIERMVFIPEHATSGVFPLLSILVLVAVICGVISITTIPFSHVFKYVASSIGFFLALLFSASLLYGWVQQSNPPDLQLHALLKGDPSSAHRMNSIRAIEDKLRDGSCFELRLPLHIWRAYHQLALLEDYWTSGGQLTNTPREGLQISPQGAAEMGRQLELIRADIHAASSHMPCSLELKLPRKLLSRWEARFTHVTTPKDNTKNLIIARTIAFFAIGTLVAFIVFLIVHG